MKRSPRVKVLDSGSPVRKQDRKHAVSTPPILRLPVAYLSMQQKNTDSLLQWEDICEFDLKDHAAVVHANIKQRNGRGKSL
jgi:hypothetical protein